MLRGRTLLMPASPIASCGTRRSTRSIRGTTSRASAFTARSAGGQNAAGAVFFHREFYDVAVANSGCHDNRMDKIWWNEAWMGEMGPHYEANSNVTAAKNLKGHLFLDGW